VQFFIWLGRVATGNFAISIASRRPVFLEVSEALANTALVAMFAVPLAFFTGDVMGAVAGSFAERWVDCVRRGGSKRIRARRVTLLPEPDSPRIHSTSPSCTVKLTPLTAP